MLLFSRASAEASICRVYPSGVCKLTILVIHYGLESLLLERLKERFQKGAFCMYVYLHILLQLSCVGGLGGFTALNSFFIVLIGGGVGNKDGYIQIYKGK